MPASQQNLKSYIEDLESQNEKLRNALAEKDEVCDLYESDIKELVQSFRGSLEMLQTSINGALAIVDSSDSAMYTKLDRINLATVEFVHIHNEIIASLVSHSDNDISESFDFIGEE
jgi:hypothetical protein